jgi:hypothetical protein
MENNRQKNLTITGAVIIGLLLIGLIFTIVSNSNGKKNLDFEKKKSEKLLSEKLSVEKDLSRLQTDFSTLKQKSDENYKLLEETNLKAADYEKRMNSIAGENRSLRANKKESEDLRKLKSDLENESSRLRSDHEKLLEQNKTLQDSLAKIKAEYDDITFKAENVWMHKTDNFLVKAIRGKRTEKLVILASRTKKINMSFEVPISLTDGISFKIVTPTGTIVKPEDKAISWHFSQDAGIIIASLSSVTGEFEQSRMVVLDYAPKEKLVKGEYKIQVLCNGNVIGNSRIRLR